MAVEARASAAGVVERDQAGAVERAGLGDTDQRAVERSAAQGPANRLVLARGQNQRQGRRSLAQVGAGDLAGLDRLPGAVEDVVSDLEGNPKREPERAEAAVAAAAEQARGLEQFPRLQRASFEVALDGRVRVVRLHALERLAAGERERRVGEDPNRLPVARLR